ncbi:hypothetical protein LAZ67_1007556 [Cordylochernes scorpioides]|uniref:Mos1 transposase HTH domain-containing protein n=1 Tax=Cordylochernes scorpioides TaxID=51811 RepID=A0ABY6K0U9_9ARAC|nr:hypothetical protein LAZ67_1007556 [Cordylochernes scorpioides]
MGDSQVKAFRNIQMYFSDDVMGVTQIKGWYNRFKDGHTSVDSGLRSDRPSTSRNDHVIAKVNSVGMWDRRLLMAEQKKHRVEVSQDMLYFINSDLNFINTIIIGDES